MTIKRASGRFLVTMLLSGLLASAGAGQEPKKESSGSRGEALQWLRQARGASAAGDTAKAKKLIGDAKSWGASQNDKLVTAWAEQMTGEIEFAGGDRAKAVVAFTAAADAFSELKNQAGIATCRLNLGRLMFADGKAKDAIKHQQEALELFQKLNRPAEIAAAHSDLAATLKALGRPAEAKDSWQKALALYREQATKQPAAELRILGELAACCDAAGATDAALQHFTAALTLAAELKDAGEEARLHNAVGMLRHKQGNLEEASKHYEIALRLFGDNNDHAAAVAATRNNLGALLQDQGKSLAALEEFAKALEIQTRIGDAPGQARTLYNMALVHEAQGQEAKAIEAYEKALVLRRKVADTGGAVKILDNLALLYANQGKTEKAKEARTEAERLRKE